MREKSVAEKFSLVRSLSRTTIQLSKRAIARADKDLDSRQIDLAFIKLHYGEGVASKFQKYASEKYDRP